MFSLISLCTLTSLCFHLNTSNSTPNLSNSFSLFTWSAKWQDAATSFADVLTGCQPVESQAWSAPCCGPQLSPALPCAPVLHASWILHSLKGWAWAHVSGPCLLGDEWGCPFWRPEFGRFPSPGAFIANSCWSVFREKRLAGTTHSVRRDASLHVGVGG